MKNKKLFIILVSLVVLGVIVLIVLLRKPSVATLPKFTPTPESPSSATISFTPPKEDKLLINNVEVNNFYKKEIGRNGANVIFLENEEYQFSYILDRNTFMISLLSSPLDSIQTKAEESFLQELGLSKDNACKLQVTILVPKFINRDEAQQTRKLSFCK